MPPGNLYNWYCVLHSVAEILGNAAEIRAKQVTSTAAALTPRCSTSTPRDKKSREDGDEVVYQYPPTPAQSPPSGPHVGTRVLPEVQEEYERHAVQIQTAKVVFDGPESVVANEPVPDIVQRAPIIQTDSSIASEDPSTVRPSSDSGSVQELELAESIPSSAVENAPLPNPYMPESAELDNPSTRKLQSSKVPSSRIGRFFHYGSLAASLGYGAASEVLRRTTSSAEGNQQGSLMMTEANVTRLVSKLSQMRGAALKLGQFMSIQDSHLLPPDVEEVFRRVQDSAHYMPDWQMEQVLASSLGSDWSEHFASFTRVPFAAASIGQVHTAVLATSSSPTGKGEPVAVKIQFPNVAKSIESDLGYVKWLLSAGRLLPPGLFLDRTIKVMKEELADECDYTREGSFLRRFGSPGFLGSDSRFKVPWVWRGSTDRVLVMERVYGSSVGGSMADKLSQEERDEIAARIIDLCLRELFVFRVMQTDPNWTNFLWNGRTRKIELVDFGATREYSKEFIDNWLRLLTSAAHGDWNTCVQWSLKLGYLTGEENDIMLNAHVTSMQLLATPFKPGTPQPFFFGRGSEWARITKQIRDQIPVMLKYRLTPPPRETYSLNRKLSGAFLLASRLGASVDCKKLWDNVVGGYRFESETPS